MSLFACGIRRWEFGTAYLPLLAQAVFRIQLPGLELLIQTCMPYCTATFLAPVKVVAGLPGSIMSHELHIYHTLHARCTPEPSCIVFFFICKTAGACSMVIHGTGYGYMASDKASNLANLPS